MNTHIPNLGSSPDESDNSHADIRHERHHLRESQSARVQEQTHDAILTLAPKAFITSPTQYQLALTFRTAAKRPSAPDATSTYTLCTRSCPCLSTCPLFSITLFIKPCTKSNSDRSSTLLCSLTRHLETNARIGRPGLGRPVADDVSLLFPEGTKTSMRWKAS